MAQYFGLSSGKAIKLSVHKLYTEQRRIILAEKYLSMSYKVVYGRSGMDYHADITVTGPNCCILQYTGKSVIYHHILMTIKLSKAYQL